MRQFHVSMAVVLSLFAAGCASTYKPVNPSSFQFQKAAVKGDSIGIQYSPNIQLISNNRWYYKKEIKHGMVAFAIRIENNSSQSVTITKENLKVFVNDQEAVVLTPEKYAKKVRQRAGRHLWHALWGPWAMSWKTEPNGETDFDGIYIPIGALVGIGNALRAGNANTANRELMKSQEVWGKEIKPKSVITGILLFKGTSTSEPSFVFVN